MSSNKKKKFTTKQIKDFAAREERVEQFKGKLPKLVSYKSRYIKSIFKF